MQDFKQLIKVLTDTVDTFNSAIPDIQVALLDKIRIELKELDLSNGNIAISAKNVALIAKIKANLLDIVLNKDYVQSVKEYAQAFNTITQIQNSYFSNLVADFTPPDVSKAIKEQALSSVVDNLTERGIDANVLSSIEDILRANITSGGSYSELQKALENNITNNSTGDGMLQRYTKQITTDSINQYSAQYTQIVSSDLGLYWNAYVGSNIVTSRPLCLACTQKRWIHVSEFPALLEGDFPEFRQFDGKLNKDGQPAGMIPDTTPSTFPLYRGGYNCGHQLRPVREDQVPIEVRQLLYTTLAYQKWAATS